MKETDSTLHLAKKPHQRSSIEPLGLAIIGGGEGATKALQALQGHPLFSLKAVLCTPQELREIIPPGCRRQSLDDLLSESEVEAVYIATPNFTHMPLAQQCLQYGRHVMVEKPLAASIAQARQVMNVDNLVLGVALKKRFGDWIQHFHELFSEDHSQLQLDVTWRIAPPQTFWRYFWQESGGGVLMDLGPHVLDLLEFLCGPALSVEGTAIFDPDNSSIDNQTKIRLVFGSGAVASVALDWLGEERVYRFGAKARECQLVHTRDSRGEDFISVSTKNGNRNYRSDPKEEYRRLFASFWQAVRGQPNTLPQLQDGLHNMQMLALAYEAVRTGKCLATDARKGEIS